jgi:drug/metabolite transporter (DMT)-like permease
MSLFCALLGAVLILGGPGILDAPPSFVDLIALISGMAFAMNNVVFRRAAQVEVVTKVAVSFVGCLGWAALLMLFGAGHIPASVPSLLWVELVAFGLIWIGLATLGTLWAVNQMEAGRSSVLIIMELVTAVVSASLLTGDTPLPLEWAGGALILFSALLEARRAPAPEALQPGDPAVCAGAPRAS